MGSQASNDGIRGIVSNFVCWAGAALASIIVAARFYTRSRLIRQIGLDDYIMLFALLLDYVGISLFSVAVSTGFGKHTSALSDDDLIRTLKIAWIAQVPQVLVLTVAKISIVVFLLKLFPRHKGLRWFLYITMSMNTIITIIPLIFIFTQCNPTAGSWNPFIQAHCWSPTTQRDFAVLSAAFSAFTDLAFVLFPVSIVWKLKLKMRIKVGLVLLLSCGLFVMASNVVEAVLIWHLAERGDFTHDAPIMYIWVVTRDHVVIIAGCVPVLKPLFTQQFQRQSSVSRLFTSLWNSTRKATHHSREARDLESADKSPKRGGFGKVFRKTDRSDSQEIILPLEAHSAPRINKVVDWEVKYEASREQETSMDL